MRTQKNQSKPAGYNALIENFQLDVVPNWHQSFIADINAHRIVQINGITEETYPNRYAPDDSVCGQLEFALKYDGTNLGILASIFHVVKPKVLEKYIQLKPKGKYARRLWFFYELLTGKKLAIDDLETGGYIDILEPSEYYTLFKSQSVRRQRINNNLLGDSRYCPMIRRTETLKTYQASDLTKKCRNLLTTYPPQLLKRAMSYLYTKETKSSFEIEHLKASSTRTERFIALLHSAETEDFCTKMNLLKLQNRIVDERFQDSDYRNTQNYIGESVSWQYEKIHYIPPRPEIVQDLMAGLIASNSRLNNDEIHAVIHATCISYGFVFVHPFEDGNGRIHRFLLHNVLARKEFTPQGIVFPISASMLKNINDYDAALENLSRPLMQLIEYKIDREGRLTILNGGQNIDIWYRYMDLTFQAEVMFRFVEQTIDFELTDELGFIVNYDKAKQGIQHIIDMPDRKIDVFIHACLQNKGHLSQRKRTSSFEFLTDAEVIQLEQTVQSSFFE